jgi:hypothetical protein
MSVTKVTGMMQTSTKGGDIPSASPTVIDTDGDYFDVTGTTNFAAFTVVAGRRFTIQFDGALTMTHHATTLDLPGAANITTAAGDVAEFFATGTNTVQCVNYTKADGTAIVAAAGTLNQASFVKMSGVQSVATGTNTKITFDTEVYDVGGNFDSSTNYRYTVGSGEDGKYLVLAHLTMSPADQTNTRIYLYKNGSSLEPPGYQSNVAAASGGHYLSTNIVAIIELAATNYLEIYGSHTNGSNNNVQHEFSHFTVARLD